MTWPLSWVRQLWERAPDVPPPAPAADGDAIRRLVVQHAVENIGHGEVGGNNQGPLIEALGGCQGDGVVRPFRRVVLPTRRTPRV